MDGSQVRVVCGTNGAPTAFRWRGRWFGVHAVLAFWVEALPWHDTVGPGRSTRCWVWRVDVVVTRSGAFGVFDLAHDGSTWVVRSRLD
jgi:hypothetical protein